MTSAEDALQRLYEDTGWREDLTDIEADALLKWAENRLTGVSAQSADSSDDFERRVDAVRRTLTTINKFVGRRANLTPEEQQTALDEAAALMNVTSIKPEQVVTQGFRSQAVDDNLPIIGAITTWLEGGELPTDPIDDARALTGIEPESVDVLAEMQEQMRGVAQSITAPEEAPPPVQTDPAAMNAILGFFNTAPEPTPPEAEDKNADTP